MSNSSLVSYTRISPNRNSPRNHKIDTITIHCYTAQASVEDMGNWLCNPSAEASANYGIGTDGRIGLFVPEGDRSWCSSSSSNDNRAITIECASDRTDPYAINSKVYNSLIALCVDICKRNGITELKWRADKSLIGQVDKQNMTVHRWFKNKACPGEYIYSRLGQIANEVNAKLGVKSEDYPETPFEVQVIIDDLSIREKATKDSTFKGYTKKGKFTITEVSGDWGKLKSGAGWIYIGEKEWCTILSHVGGTSANKPAANSGEYQVYVGIPDLCIRTGAGTNYSLTGKHTGIGTFTIVEEKNGWGRLKSGAGWISLAFTTKL
jgi:hypothetical protein